MHLLETYALSTGSKISKPFIIKKYFPLPTNKYITIQNSSGMNGKCYDYYQEVIDFIYDDLEKIGYKIIQIGSKEDKPLKKVINLQGQTNINQTAFILDNSSLHVGNDSFAIHMCSAFDVPLIGLYSVSSPEIAGPFWKNNKQICLTPKDWRPSFNPNESPKKVNEILIEDIVKSVFSLLNINTQNNIETIHIGEDYDKFFVEVTSNQIIPKDIFPNENIHIRLDYKEENLDESDYQSIYSNLNIRNCVIITDKALNLKPFFNLKSKVSCIFYNITNNINKDFIKEANMLGFKLVCIFDLNKDNEKILNQRKFELIDYPQSVEIVEFKNIFTFKVDNNTYYKSNKILIANNKFYLSRQAYKENKSIDINNYPLIQPLNEIQNLESFYNYDSKYSLIFKK
jgi:hypothetical protein